MYIHAFAAVPSQWSILGKAPLSRHRRILGKVFLCLEDPKALGFPYMIQVWGPFPRKKKQIKECGEAMEYVFFSGDPPK